MQKQEPADHDSSAYGSGSDGFHSSSPGGSDQHSRDSSDQPTIVYNTDNMSIGQYYTTPIPQNSLTKQFLHNTPITGFNPLTPPSFEPMVSPRNTQNGEVKPDQQYLEMEKENTALTPCHTPPSEDTPPKSPKNEENEYFKGDEDHLRRLQMAFEKNTMLPSSPKSTDNRDSGEDDGKSDYDIDEVDENGIRIPRVNSHGKVKTFKCKQCEFVAVTKLDFWEHSRAHIKADKLLTCPKCPFVTEYKHHLEYHLRNHFGSKPFKCDKCSYSCVNKSMLNSHLKSHSNVYQYRCSDCTYATKYCHSLKLHLRKYKHNPAMVLNVDGTPNPLPIIDVYGTRRGPKQKSHAHQSPQQLSKEEIMSTPPQTQLPPHSIFNPFISVNAQQPVQFPFPWLGAFSGALTNPLLFPQLTQQNEELNTNPTNERSSPDSIKEKELPDTTKMDEETATDDGAALDLSKPEIRLPITVPEIPVQSPLAVPLISKNRRKGRAFKLERLTVNQEASSDEEEECAQKENENEKEQKMEEDVTEKKSDIYNCQYCDILFKDVIMYTMHMGYHGYKDPFTCNMCGKQSGDKVEFFLHIARTSHS